MTFGKRQEVRKPKNIRNYVVWLLGRREHSEHELRKRLVQRGCDTAEIEDALKFVKEYDYQSDTRYASMKARSESSRRGNRRISMVLAQKGIAKTEVEEQIATLAPESERAIAAVGRFEGKPLDQKLRQKVWRFLASRGFTSSAISAAVKHLLSVREDALDHR
jgi:regulatory protein